MRGYELLFPDLRKNLSMAALEAQGIENDYVIDETTGKAAWTPEHIEWLYKAYSNPGSKTESNYSKAYATFMSPADFLSLTATDSARARIKLESVRKYGELDADKLKSDMGSPYLDIDFETGTATGHEGRHRMVLMQNAGIEQVPVVITPYKQGDKFLHTIASKNFWRETRMALTEVKQALIDGLKLREVSKGKAAAIYCMIETDEKRMDMIQYILENKKGTEDEFLNEARRIAAK